jgi:hypothetical protein
MRDKSLFKISMAVVATGVLACASTGLAQNLRENLVVNPRFQTPESTRGGNPTTYGTWQGDFSEIVNGTSGVGPASGSRMLQFISTGPDGPSQNPNSAVRQLIDVSSNEWQSFIRSGQAMASASALFNRIEGNGGSNNMFRLGISAHSGTPDQFATQWENHQWLARNYSEILTDADPETWEQTMVDLVLPTETQFISIWVAGVQNNIRGNRFGGHFADQVNLRIVPAPGAAALAVLGLLAGTMRRRRTE